MAGCLPHERLDIYHESLSWVLGSRELAAAWPSTIAARDHLIRAGESILTNLAKAARRRKTAQGVYHVECALGSVLECAACLDVAHTRSLITASALRPEKESLQRVARMAVGLRASWSGSAAEGGTAYGAASEFLFPHESLKAYQVALQLTKMLAEGPPTTGRTPCRNSRRIDETATSLVLNIAEGNGRFSMRDHAKFIGIAQDAASLLGVHLDLDADDSSEGTMAAKALLRRIAALLAGLSSYLHKGDGVDP